MSTETARRYNSGKTRHDLMSPWAIEEVAKVMTYGANKYTVKDDKGNVVDSGDRNWEKGQLWSTPIASLRRHFLAFEMGEDFDPESKLYHMAHVAWNALAILHFYKTYPQGDNRPVNAFKMPRVGLDIDGVLADFTGAYKERVLAAGLPWFPGEDQQWWALPHITTPFFDKIVKDKSFWLGLKPLCDPREWKFEPVAYITRRLCPKAWSEEWLFNNGFPPVQVYSIGKEEKSEYVKKCRVEIYVEDCPWNMAEVQQAGVFCFLLDQPYNRRFDVGHRRIYSLNEVIR